MGMVCPKVRVHQAKRGAAGDTTWGRGTHNLASTTVGTYFDLRPLPTPSKLNQAW